MAGKGEPPRVGKGEPVTKARVTHDHEIRRIERIDEATRSDSVERARPNPKPKPEKE